MHDPIRAQTVFADGSVLTDEYIANTEHAILEGDNMTSKTKAQLVAESERLARRLAEHEAKLAELDALPTEDDLLKFSDGAIVLYFRKEFKYAHFNQSSESKYYQYTAHRAANGLWYISGAYAQSSGMNGVAWEELLGWIMDSARYEIWVVSNMERLEV